MVSGFDEHVCGVSSVMTAGELDVRGDSSGVQVDVAVDDVVACGDDPLFPDAVHVGGWLSVVGDPLMCGAGVTRSDRGETEVEVGPGVVQPGWVDGLICTDCSLRPEPTPMHATCLRLAL